MKKAIKSRAQQANEYESYLNDLYSMGMTAEAVIEQLCHLKAGKIKEDTIRKHIAESTAGSLLRKYDSIGFYAGLNDYLQDPLNNSDL